MLTYLFNLDLYVYVHIRSKTKLMIIRCLANRIVDNFRLLEFDQTLKIFAKNELIVILIRFYFINLAKSRFFTHRCV